MSLMYIEKRCGKRRKLCGTPACSIIGVEVKLPILTSNVQLQVKHLIIFKIWRSTDNLMSYVHPKLYSTQNKNVYFCLSLMSL